MFQNDLLDLAIGLVFVWFILSLVVSVVNEGFVLVFRIRAKHLWLGIGRLVNPRDGRYARRLWEPAAGPARAGYSTPCAAGILGPPAQLQDPIAESHSGRVEPEGRRHIRIDGFSACAADLSPDRN
jgi:hypothetical protein